MHPLTILIVLFVVFLCTHAWLVGIVYHYERENMRMRRRLDSHGKWLADLELKDLEHDRKLDSAARLIRDRPVSTFILPPRTHAARGGDS